MLLFQKKSIEMENMGLKGFFCETVWTADLNVNDAFIGR